MQTSSQPHWQNTIHPTLLQRLLRSPGVIRSQVADNIRSRSESWSNRLPLLAQISQRHIITEDLQTGQMPIVYAQPRPVESSPDAVANPIESSAPRSNQTTVIQAKFAPGSTSANQGVSQVKANAVKPSARSNQSSATRNIPAIENAHDLSILERQPPQVSTQFDLPVMSARSQPNVSTSAAIATESPPLSASKLPVVQAKFANNALVPSQSANAEVFSSGQEYQFRNSEERDRSIITSEQKLAIKKINVKESNQPSFASVISEMNSIAPVSLELSPEQGLTHEVSVEARSKLPLVRSTPPQDKVNRDAPLVFSDAANRNRSSSVPLEMHPNDSSKSPTVSKSISTSTAQESGRYSSVVRSIPQQLIQEAEEPSSLPNQVPQTIVSRAAPPSPPAIDVDALADKVERKLARRMVIERERRGWK